MKNFFNHDVKVTLVVLLIIAAIVAGWAISGNNKVSSNRAETTSFNLWSHL